MTRLEMIRLALKGYKPGEIAELQELERSADSEVIEEPEADPIEEPEVDEELPVVEDDDTVENPQDTVDYKAQYEEAMKKLAELQQQNIQQNLAGKEKSDDEIMSSLLHKFIK